MICFLYMMYLKGDIFVNKELENFLKEKKDTNIEFTSILEKAKVEDQGMSTVSESARKSNLMVSDENKNEAQKDLSRLSDNTTSVNLSSLTGKSASENTTSVNLTASSDNKESSQNQKSSMAEIPSASNLAQSTDKKQGNTKSSGGQKGGNEQKDNKDPKSDGKDLDVKNIKIKNKDAVLVKPEGGKDKLSVVVVSDQSAMKNKEELKKLVAQVNGSDGKLEDKKDGATADKSNDKKETTKGGDQKSRGGAAKGSSLINLSGEETTQEGKMLASSELAPLDKMSKDKKVSTVLINNKPKAIVLNVKTFTIVESISDVKAPATKDNNIKSISSISKGNTEKKEEKSKNEKSASNKSSDEKKTESDKKKIEGGKQESRKKSPIKYEAGTTDKSKTQDKESVWSNIFTMSSPDTDKQNKRLNNQSAKQQQKSVQGDKKTTSDKLGKDKGITDKIDKAKKTDVTKEVKKAVSKQESPDSKKVVESVVFLGKDKALKTISKKDFAKKNKETSMDDLLYVLKNMPGKVNINKEGKEVYIEGDFFTPKEKNMARKEFKFSGVLKAKDAFVKQK